MSRSSTAKFVSHARERLVTILAALAVLGAHSAWAQTTEEQKEEPPEPFGTVSPIKCPEDVACWIVDYVDRDRSRNALDYKCGLLTSDRHKSTDFAVSDIAAVRLGVPVVATAAGKIVGVRNNMEDRSSEPKEKSTSRKRTCGNGVLIEHQEGWTSQYCHLRKDSVTVEVDQEVGEGQIIGMVGLSGQTEYPHLSFTVRHDKAEVDPFVGLESSNECVLGSQQLWKNPSDPVLAYIAPNVIRGGFSDLRPSVKGPAPVIEDRPAMSRQIRSIYLWADFEGLRPHDELWFRIFSPDGNQVLEHKTPIKDHHFGKRVYIEFQKRQEIWSGGQYRGSMTLRRRYGAEIKDFVLEHTVEMR